MNKVITIKLNSGDLKTGFSVSLEIAIEGQSSSEQKQGSLPPAIDLLNAYNDWRSIYINLGNSRLDSPKKQVKNVSEPESCEQLAKIVIQSLNHWLNSQSFRPLRETLLIECNKTQELLKILIQTDDLTTQRLPWHLWELCEKYPHVEIGYCRPQYQQILPPLKLQKKVRILAIIGDNKNIKPEADLATWEKDGAEVKYLLQPQRQDINDQLWQKGWDILFFAGHSNSEIETGSLKINSQESLPLDQLKYGLKQAIFRGLQLAIFNSCDGIELARYLADLNIPLSIFMRESVPDKVCQKFLDFFLKEYTQGESLYLSVRKAREQLQGLETEFPCATWLPVIYQNPAIISPSWEELRQGRRKLNFSFLPPFQQDIYPVLLASFAVCVCLLGVRSLGFLEFFEFKVYNHFMQNRPDEGKDQRLLIVTIDEEDIDYQDQQGMERKGSLSDTALAQMIEKIEPLQPRVIGLDIYRNFSVNSNYPQLAEFFKTSQNFIVICKDSDRNNNSLGVKPPPEVPPERLGFSNILTDRDGVIRRHFWYMTPPLDSPCPTEKSLSLQVAVSYLEQEGIQPKTTPDGYLKLGQVTLKPLEYHLGGYHKLDTRGYQMLLNYRSGDIAETISLRQLLTTAIPPDLVRDKIILIGNIAESYKDYHQTPLTRDFVFNEKMPGILIQAQMVSEIVSAVQDGRPLLTVIPRWVERFWIGGWSFFGAILGWRVHPFWIFYGSMAGSFVILYSICLISFWGGYWLPFVPSASGLLITSAIVKQYHQSS